MPPMPDYNIPLSLGRGDTGVRGATSLVSGQVRKEVALRDFTQKSARKRAKAGEMYTYDISFNHLE